MRFRYSEWDYRLAFRRLTEKNLRQLFNYLLLQTNGNVKDALSIMKYLQLRGVLSDDIDLDEFQSRLEDGRLISTTGDSKRLTAKGESWLRQESLKSIFSSLELSGAGSHPIHREGNGLGEVLGERRPFQFGDAASKIDYKESYLNAIRRAGLKNPNIRESDLAVWETEATTSAATVLLLDISHSMILYGEDRITPAKQVALALTHLIKTQYPKDSLDVVVFGDDARRIELKHLPYTGVGPYHTNTQAGLQMGRELLYRRKSLNRQIFMITDGKPTVVRRRGGELYKNSFGLDPYIVNRTLDEALICRKKKIVITTFMVASDPYLRSFVQKLTKLNQGRAYFSPLNNLGGFIFQDFMANR